MGCDPVLLLLYPKVSARTLAPLQARCFGSLQGLCKIQSTNVVFSAAVISAKMQITKDGQ